MKTYRQLEDDIVVLRVMAAREFRQEHPIGSLVWYWKGDNEIHVEIVEHELCMTGNLRVKVRGKRGKEYWIYAGRIEEMPR